MSIDSVQCTHCSLFGIPPGLDIQAKQRPGLNSQYEKNVSSILPFFREIVVSEANQTLAEFPWDILWGNVASLSIQARVFHTVHLQY